MPRSVMLYKVRIAGLLRTTDIEAASPEEAALARANQLPASAWAGESTIALDVEDLFGDHAEFVLRAERRIVLV